MNLSGRPLSRERGKYSDFQLLLLLLLLELRWEEPPAVEEGRWPLVDEDEVEVDEEERSEEGMLASWGTQGQFKRIQAWWMFGTRFRDGCELLLSPWPRIRRWTYRAGMKANLIHLWRFSQKTFRQRKREVDSTCPLSGPGSRHTTVCLSFCPSLCLHAARLLQAVNECVMPRSAATLPSEQPQKETLRTIPAAGSDAAFILRHASVQRHK